MALNILFINSSARGDHSESKNLAEEIVQKLSQEGPGASVVRLDVATDQPPAVTMDWIMGAYTPAEGHSDAQKAAMAVSDGYIDALFAADVLVLAAPMYNFGVPATLKLWIDQIVRINRTFSPSYEGLVKGKRAFVTSARGGGGYGPGGFMDGADYVVPYLKQVLGLIGITDVTFLDIENTASSNENYQATKSRAQEKVQTLSAA